MSLNLTNLVRISNPYLAEIDELRGTKLPSFLNGSGAAVVPNVGFHLSKNSRTVEISMFVPLVFNVASGADELNFTAFDVSYAPPFDLSFVICGSVDTAVGEEQVLILEITTAGVISIGRIGNSRFFTVGKEVLVYPFSVSYNLL